MTTVEVVDKPIEEKASCPRCHREVWLMLSTWEGWWAVRFRQHAASKGSPVPCDGSTVTLKRGQVS